MKTLLLIAMVVLVGCSRKVANYKFISPNSMVVWRYTKPGEMQKDVLSTGDTLCSNPKTGELFMIRGVDTLAPVDYLKKLHP